MKSFLSWKDVRKNAKDTQNTTHTQNTNNTSTMDDPLKENEDDLTSNQRPKKVKVKFSWDLVNGFEGVLDSLDDSDGGGDEGFLFNHQK